MRIFSGMNGLPPRSSGWRTFHLSTAVQSKRGKS